MLAANPLKSIRWKRGLDVASSTSIGIIGLGLYIGMTAISMWRQWSLTFGQDPELLLAVAVVLAMTFWLGSRWRRARPVGAMRDSWISLIFCLAALSVLYPFWVDGLTIFMSAVPLSWLENSVTKTLVVASLAVLGWSIPGTLWSALFQHASDRANASVSEGPSRQALLLCGIVGGLIANSLIFGPWMGVFDPTVISSLIVTTVLWRWRHHAFGQNGPIAPSQALQSPIAAFSLCLRAVMACLAGALLACNLRLVNQLMPHAPFVVDMQIAGVLLGISFGLALVSRRNSTPERAAIGGLFAAATSTALLAAQPMLVDLSLWMNASFSTVAILLSARAGLMIALTMPFGLSLACVASSNENEDGNLTSWGAPFVAGLGFATFLLSGFVGLMPIMGVCNGLMVIAALALKIGVSGWRFSLRTSIATACLVGVSASGPVWRSCDDASRAAKLLFSAPSFVAYRSGWTIEQLPYLDDVRMIDRLEGRTGPLTLWRGRGVELYIRDNGVPRSVITKASEAVPQFPVEVLQAVYPLVICERPGRVLFLGLSSGVSLATCLRFPIQEAICVEGDDNWVEMIRGPVVRETGFDPFDDDRVVLKKVSPELALMAGSQNPYDVILDCPSSPAMSDGSVSYTQEFYQRVSQKLSERGVFCQRFECVDVGPEPLRLVLKAIRKSFREVIAVELAPGELLLLAANSDRVFLPRDLGVRLETSHVCHVLARSGLDWTALLNLPAYDQAALEEICHESRRSANTILHGQLAALAPLEMMRWANKQQEIQTVLTANRVSDSPFAIASIDEPNPIDGTARTTSRRSRFMEWLEELQSSKELVRRLGEVAAQQKIVRDNPDQHWWSYRKTLKAQLQDHPRSAIQQVKAIDEKRTLHPEDANRRDYFEALGKAVAAAREAKPTREQITAIEEHLEPYDPLVSYFGRQEIADLLSQCGEDAAREIAYRLYVIYFAPSTDLSVRNVSTAIQTVIKHPEAIPDDSVRFDLLNGLIQTLRIRWEVRQSVQEDSLLKIMDDVDKSLLAVENGLRSMDGLAQSAGVSETDWQMRKQVIERLMLLPLRTYRTTLQTRRNRGAAATHALLEEANKRDKDGDEDKASNDEL